MTEQEKTRAIENAIPQKPRRVELGGDIYYKCHWLSCGESLNKWFRYCPKCGCKLDWEDAYVDELEKLFFTDTQT